MITIYGSPKSSSGRCFWCLEEIGAKYEAKSVNFKEKEHKSEAYLKINPNGKVPALVDDGFVMSESMAINLYLAEKYKPELLGKSINDKAKVSQWSIWAIADLQPPLIDIFIQLVFVPEERRDTAVIEKAQKKLPDLLEILDTQLENNDYLIGNEFSLADLNVNSVVSICFHVNYDLSKYENIKRWLSKIGERPAFKKYMELCQ